jgi:hypothetical protein
VNKTQIKWADKLTKSPAILINQSIKSAGHPRSINLSRRESSRGETELVVARVVNSSWNAMSAMKSNPRIVALPQCPA